MATKNGGKKKNPRIRVMRYDKDLLDSSQVRLYIIIIIAIVIF